MEAAERTKIDVKAVYEDISSMAVVLEEDPVAAGGIAYINRMLKNLRDMTEVLNRHLMAVKRALSNQARVNSRAKLLYKVKHRDALGKLTPLQKRGKAMAEIEALLKQTPEMLQLEQEIQEGEEEEQVLRTLGELLDGRMGDLKRANSDVRLQAASMDLVKASAKTGGATASEWAEKRMASDDRLNGTEVEIGDIK